MPAHPKGNHEGLPLQGHCDRREGVHGTRYRRLRMFSVGTAGGRPPPQERMIRLLSVRGSMAAFTLATTSAGVPWARTSRGGIFPKSVTLGPVHSRICRQRMLEAEVEEVDADLAQELRTDPSLGIVVEETHGHVETAEHPLEIRQGGAAKIGFAQEADDVIEHEDAFDGGQTLFLLLQPIDDEIGDQRQKPMISSGLVRTAIRNSVVPIRKLAILSGPRETANRRECPASVDGLLLKLQAAQHERQQPIGLDIRLLQAAQVI